MFGPVGRIEDIGRRGAWARRLFGDARHARCASETGRVAACGTRIRQGISTQQMCLAGPRQIECEFQTGIAGWARIDAHEEIFERLRPP